MSIFRTMTEAERTAFFDDEGVKSFLGRIAKRDITGIEVPETFLGIIKENIEDYSKLYKHITVKDMQGTGRAVITDLVGEAVWQEACAELNELDLKMTDAEFNAYQVGGFFTLCNASIQDSVINLAEEVAEALMTAIGKAIDRAIIEGDGIKEPLGIVTRLAQKNEPSTYPPTAREWENLTDHIIEVSGQGGQLYKEIVEAGGTATGKFSTSQRVWLMNSDTLNTLKAEGISVGIVGGVTDGTGILGGIIETLSVIPDNTIVTGFFDDYILAERQKMTVERSEHPKFMQNKTVFRGIGLYDGKPVIPEAFAVISFTVQPGPTPGGNPEPITITENGTYTNANGYSPVTVNVPQGKVRTTYYNGDITVTNGTASITFDEIMGDVNAEVAGVLKLNGVEYAFWRKKLNDGKNTFRSDTAITMTPVFVDDGDDFVGLNLTDLPLADGTYTALVTDTPDQPASAMTYRTNGTHTVLDEGLVIVDVPQPTGDTFIQENGMFDVTQYAQASIMVDPVYADGEQVYRGLPAWQYDRGVYYATVEAEMTDGMVNVLAINVVQDEDTGYDFQNVVYNEYGQVVNGRFEGDDIILEMQSGGLWTVVSLSDDEASIDTLGVIITQKEIQGGGGGGDTLGEALAGTLTNYENSDLTEIKAYQFYGGTYNTGRLSFPNVTATGAMRQLSQWTQLYGNSFGGWDGDISIPKLQSMQDSDFSDTGIVNANFPLLTSIARSGFLRCKMASADFSSVTHIAMYGLSQLPNLETLTLPSAYSINGQAFAQSTKLKRVQFDSGFPQGLSGSSMFSGCTALEAVIFTYNPSSGIVPLNNTSVFTGSPIADGTGYIYVPDEKVEQYKAATNWSVYADQIKPMSELA